MSRLEYTFWHLTYSSTYVDGRMYTSESLWRIAQW